MLTRGLPVHLKVFQQVGRINNHYAIWRNLGSVNHGDSKWQQISCQSLNVWMYLYFCFMYFEPISINVEMGDGDGNYINKMIFCGSSSIQLTNVRTCLLNIFFGSDVMASPFSYWNRQRIFRLKDTIVTRSLGSLFW